MNNIFNKTYTPKYDNDSIPKWYLEQRLQQEFTIVGEVRTYMGSNLPEGWLLCDGSEISRNRYSTLFSILGEEYGVGDGISTFELPTLTDNDNLLGYKIIKY